jgi:hypothetical protein
LAPQNDVFVGTINSIVFNTTLGLPATAITLSGGVLINNATQSFGANQSVNLVITGLDMSNAGTAQNIINLQRAGQLGGLLLLDPLTQNITSGDVHFDGTAGRVSIGTALVPALGLNVPGNVTLTFQNYQPSNPINIDLGAASTAVVDGIIRFVGTAANISAPVINLTAPSIISSVTISSAKGIASDGTLTINGGTPSSPIDLVLNGALAANSTDISSPTMTITAANITGKGIISAESLQMTATRGDISQAPYSRVPFVIDPLIVSARATSTTGNVFLFNDDTSPVTLDSSGAGATFQFSSLGPVIITNSLTAGSVVLAAGAGLGSLITIGAGANISATADVSLQANNLTNGGSIFANPQTGQIRISSAPNGSLNVDGTGTLSAG